MKNLFQVNKIASKAIKIKQNNALFLPDFCSFPIVLSVVIIAELLAFILTLAPLSIAQQGWNDLALTSLFIQWNALMCSSTLCLLRPLIKYRSPQFIAISSYLSILLTFTLLSEITFYVINEYKITRIIETSTHWEFLVHNLLIGGIISALALRYFYIQHQWRIRIETESATRLQLLQARIRPHFLFNSLNSIASLTQTRPDIAERITEDLADLFRMIIREDKTLIHWSREKELSEHYIDIEKQRLGTRLNIQWHTDNIPHKALVPALLLQPLLENAIFHGIEPVIHGGHITVTGELIRHHLHIEIQNSNSKNLVHRQGNQIALKNIKERLHSHFSENASIHFWEQENNYYVKIILPYKEHTES
ncbi:MAG: histidine kinase [Gammaproteobacteria bacterium]|nr:histidine kinase [Gammaproteobacteria bacterium]